MNLKVDSEKSDILTISSKGKDKNFKLYDKDYQSCTGIKIEFSDAIDISKVGIDAEVWRYDKDKNALYIALNSNVKLNFQCTQESDKYKFIHSDTNHILSINIPAEIKQAKGIVADRADIITNAKREADGIIRGAEDRAKVMVAQEEIVKLSQAKAAEIIASAQTKSREMRKAAQDFVDDIMRRADEGLTANLGEVRKTRAALKQQVPTSKE